MRTDYYNNHRNADYFTDNTPSPASVPARPSKPQAHAATPQKIAPKAQPAHADAKHSAKVSMRSIMDDATGLAQKSEACVKQAWGDVEKTVTHAWNHPKQDALRVFNDGTRVLHDFDSGLVDGAVSTVKNTAHAVATISQDIYHGAEITFTDPGQAWRNVEYDTAGIRTHISSVAQQAEQGVVTWSNHPTQAWHNVEINTAHAAYKVANYANKEAHSLMNMNAYQIGEAVGSGVVIALPAIMTGGATAEAEAAGSVFEASAVETSGETASQVGFFGRGAGGFTRSLGAEAVESSQMAAADVGGGIEAGASNIEVSSDIRGGLFENKEVTRPRMLSKSERISSNMVNKEFISDEAKAGGWEPPYPANRSIRKITTAREIKLYRVHTLSDKPEGRFFAREKELAPFMDDPATIRSHFGLPDKPIYITEVNVPANTELYVGRIGSQPTFGKMEDAGFQYQSAGRLPDESFTNTKLLLQSIPELTF